MYPGWCRGIQCPGPVWYCQGPTHAIFPTRVPYPGSHIPIQGPISRVPYPGSHMTSLDLILRVPYDQSGPHSQGPIYRVPYTGSHIQYPIQAKQCQIVPKTVPNSLILTTFLRCTHLLTRPFDWVWTRSGTARNVYPHGMVPLSGTLNGHIRPSDLRLVDSRFTMRNGVKRVRRRAPTRRT